MSTRLYHNDADASAILDPLNAEQRKAVTAASGYALVLAQNERNSAASEKAMKHEIRRAQHNVITVALLAVLAVIIAALVL